MLLGVAIKNANKQSKAGKIHKYKSRENGQTNRQTEKERKNIAPDPTRKHLKFKRSFLLLS